MSNDKELYELGDVSPKLFFTEGELKAHGIVASNFSPKIYDIDWDKVGLAEVKLILQQLPYMYVEEGTTAHKALEHLVKPREKR